MRQDRPANPQTVGQTARDDIFASDRCREIGLAAVAAALDLPIETLEPEMAEAIERGGLLMAPPRSMLAA
jgi:hypothetical protein